MTREQRLVTLREDLARLEHDQWLAWSQSLATSEPLSPERIVRWARLWVAYDDLEEADKEADREWADKALGLLKRWVNEA